MKMGLKVDSQRRYGVFVERVSAEGTVWGLKSDEGWAIVESNEFEDTGVMLFWSDEAYAKQCAAEEWEHYVPTAISLEEFSPHWLHGMHEDDVLAGVNWNKELIGLEVEPLDLLKDLQG